MVQFLLAEKDDRDATTADTIPADEESGLATPGI